VTSALTTSAERQLTTGLWLISRESSGKLRWGAPLESTNETHMLTTLRHANQHGETLNQAVNQTPTEAPPTPRTAPAPRKVLADPLARQGSPVPLARLWETLHRHR